MQKSFRFSENLGQTYNRLGLTENRKHWTQDELDFPREFNGELITMSDAWVAVISLFEKEMVVTLSGSCDQNGNVFLGWTVAGVNNGPITVGTATNTVAPLGTDHNQAYPKYDWNNVLEQFLKVLPADVGPKIKYDLLTMFGS